MKAWLGWFWVPQAGAALVGGAEGRGERQRCPTTANANPMKKSRRAVGVARRRRRAATDDVGVLADDVGRLLDDAGGVSRRRRAAPLTTSGSPPDDVRGRPFRGLSPAARAELPRRGRAGPASPGPRAAAMPPKRKRSREEAAETDRLTAGEAAEVGRLFIKGGGDAREESARARGTAGCCWHCERLRCGAAERCAQLHPSSSAAAPTSSGAIPTTSEAETRRRATLGDAFSGRQTTSGCHRGVVGVARRAAGRARRRRRVRAGRRVRGGGFLLNALIIFWFRRVCYT